jgi:hypothetical protein
VILGGSLRLEADFLVLDEDLGGGGGTLEAGPGRQGHRRDLGTRIHSFYNNSYSKITKKLSIPLEMRGQADL